MDPLAPFTLPFACGYPAPILLLLLCVNLSEAARGRSGAYPPMDVEVQYWQTEPV